MILFLQLVTFAFFSDINCACSECEPAEMAVGKSCTAHDVEHFIALGHCRDAFGQIAVGAFVVRDETPCKWN